MNALRIASMLIGPAPDARMTLCTKAIPHRREGAQAFSTFVPVFSGAVPSSLRPSLDRIETVARVLVSAMGDLQLGSSPVENDPNRLGQQYLRTKVRPVCKRRAVGLGASTNGTNTFVLMDALC
jgi:hypothetical protein